MSSGPRPCPSGSICILLLCNFGSLSHDGLGNFAGSDSSLAARLCQRLKHKWAMLQDRGRENGRTLDGKLLWLTLTWKAYLSFCLQPKMILACSVPSAWPKNKPFPRKALRQIQKWDPPHQRCPGAVAGEAGTQGRGPARNASLLSTKGGAQVGCFSQTLPIPLPCNEISYLFQGLGQF